MERKPQSSVVVLDFAAPTPEPVPFYEGRLELIADNFVAGWVCDVRDLDIILKVELWSGDRPVAATMANVRRDDLRKAGVGDGNHGFIFRLRVPSGNLTVRVSGTSHILKRSDGFRDLTRVPQAQTAQAEAPPPPAAAAAPLPAPDVDAFAIIDESGLFDRKYYLEQNADVAQAGLDPLRHYCESGYKEQRRPNFYFDKNWYAARISRDPSSADNLLVHYIREGERAGLTPSLYFDAPWYRATYELGADQSPLAHYLEACRSENVSPIAAFDAEYYASRNPDVRQAGIDMFHHYIENGWREGRNPSSSFDSLFYVRRHLGGGVQNPLAHYLTVGKAKGLVATPSDEVTWASEIKKFSAAGPLFEDRRPRRRATPPRAKLLAYYLPQYHAFRENDLWWGKGFTEWTNVIRGAPRFKGHYQPRVPGDLGFYNLLSPGVMREQIEMARDAGVFGFVFYFYAFGKRRLMEAPLENFLADPTLDFPFALMWANEDWTRSWDGLSKDVLIAQEFSDDDDPELISTWLRHFRDPRYIRVDGRPLVFIYRPGLIPKMRARLSRWRKRILADCGLDPIFVMAQGFGDSDPRKFGFDGAVEFPPHKVGVGLDPINAKLEVFDLNFSAAVLPYEKVVERSLGEPAPEYPLIKCALPSWDNDARRQGAGMTIHGSTPAAYQAWLEKLIDHAERNPFFGEKLVCVNAWNEWAEGAYLEPDAYFGAAYLNATARAVLGAARELGDKICLVGHDAHAHGAQFLVRSLAEIMTRRFGLEVELVLLDGGKLLPAYHEIAPTTLAKSAGELKTTFARLRDQGFRYAILNSTASSRAASLASAAGLEVVMLVHELPSIIEEMKLEPVITEALPFIRSFVFPAEFVRSKFLELFEVDIERTLIRPQGSYSPIGFSESARLLTRAALGVRQGDTLVLGVGYADLRKGFDLFLQTWRCARKRGLGTHFVWVGDIHPVLETYLAAEIEAAKASGTFHAIPFTAAVSDYYSAADVYLLTSREDPFPTVVLEALHTGIPAIAFEGSGGIPEMLRRHDAGIVAAMADPESAADAISSLRSRWSREPRDPSQRLIRLVDDLYAFPDYAFGLLDAGRTRRLKISVVVPNYNYARHLKARLTSIFDQTHPIYELIVLDDGSTDSSLEVLGEIAQKTKRKFEVVPSPVNSGSVFAQWRKATERASGDYIWIAEADDMAAPLFLERLAAIIQESDGDFTLAYCDSRSVDENGVELSPSYKFYYRESATGVFERDQAFDGEAFVREHLSERNMILNVSACLWRRSVLLDAMEASGDTLQSYRLAGDWHLYVTALLRSGGKVGYVADALNIHRRHVESVTKRGLSPERHVDEIRRVQLMVREYCPAGATAASRQDAYLREVAKHLGAPEAAAAALGEEFVAEPERVEELLEDEEFPLPESPERLEEIRAGAARM